MADKRNKHARTGYGVETPLDSIHLGTDRHIRLESVPPEDATGDKRVGRRSYNDARYLKRPIEVPVGTVFVLGYDTEGNVILTAINPNDIITEAGVGLSKDIDGKVQLGDGLTIEFTPETIAENDGRLDIYGKGGYYFQDAEFIAELFQDRVGTLTNRKIIQTLGGYFTDYLYQAYIINEVFSNKSTSKIFTSSQSGNSGAAVELLSDALKSYLVLFAYDPTTPSEQVKGITLDTSQPGILVKDTINQKGLTEEADYSANKTDFSYATKKMLDDGLAGATGISIVAVPANKTSAGLIGQIASDADFTYIYVGDNTTHLWDRIAKDTTTW
jgi:hypothetical protein